MDILTTAVMRSLIGHDRGPCVSLYLPTHRAGRETRQGEIRLRNLVGRAESDLEAAGVRSANARSLLSEAAGLAEDHEFWQHQEDGLAVFIAPDRLTTLRLPADFEEMVVVGEAFHTKPLWPVVAGDEIFYILALSRNQIRLLWADRFRVGEVALPADLPAGMAEALWFVDADKQVQYHGADRVGRGDVAVSFHGHGVPDERDDARLESYLRMVDEGIRHLIEDRDPLVLAAVDEVAARYRRITGHPAVVEGAVSGNPDDLRAEDLHERALDLMAPRFGRARRDDAARLAAAGDLAVRAVPTVVSAALAGRVEAVFLPLGVHSWGRAGEAPGEVEIHDERRPGDRDLLDLAGAAVWSAGGRVHAVPPAEVPGGGEVAALLRY